MLTLSGLKVLFKKFSVAKLFEILRNMYELQTIEKIEIRYQPRNKCFYIFTFLLFVGLLTD